MNAISQPIFAPEPVYHDLDVLAELPSWRDMVIDAVSEARYRLPAGDLRKFETDALTLASYIDAHANVDTHEIISGLTGGWSGHGLLDDVTTALMAIDEDVAQRNADGEGWTDLQHARARALWCWRWCGAAKVVVGDVA